MKRQALVLAVILAVLSGCSKNAGFIEIVRTGTPGQVQAAIDRGADVNSQGSTGGRTALMYAAWRNPNPEVVAILLRAGANANASDITGRTALLYASQFNSNPAVVAALLEGGANLNAKDTTGATSMMYAAQFNPNAEVIATLAKAGADVNARQGAMGRTVLMMAVSRGTNPSAVPILLRLGADAKARDDTGKTALDLAQENGRLKGTDALKELGDASK